VTTDATSLNGLSPHQVAQLLERGARSGIGHGKPGGVLRRCRKPAAGRWSGRTSSAGRSLPGAAEKGFREAGVEAFVFTFG
jgi:hypothetical protein